jgi:anion-transporting  ArsA/GET3 family ATPase
MTGPGGIATGRMLVVTGKGGVGKTLVTAALGDALARAGRRVLLIEVDPRESLYQAVGASPSGGEKIRVPLNTDGEGTRRPAALEDRRRPAAEMHGALWLQNLQPRHVIEQMVREHLRIDWLSRRVIANSVFQHFIDSAPGLKELAVLAYAMRALDRKPDAPPPDVDTIVLDAPATGHGVALLAAPQVVATVIEQEPFGRMAREMTAFVADPNRLGIIVVTKAEEVPALEARELFTMLDDRVHRSPELLVVNGLYPPLPSHLPGLSAHTSVLRNWARHRQTNDRELAGLVAACDVPIAELPLLPINAGPRLAAALGCQLASALDIAEHAA